MKQKQRCMKRDTSQQSYLQIYELIHMVLAYVAPYHGNHLPIMWDKSRSNISNEHIFPFASSIVVKKWQKKPDENLLQTCGRQTTDMYCSQLSNTEKSIPFNCRSAHEMEWIYYCIFMNSKIKKPTEFACFVCCCFLICCNHQDRPQYTISNFNCNSGYGSYALFQRIFYTLKRMLAKSYVCICNVCSRLLWHRIVLHDWNVMQRTFSSRNFFVFVAFGLIFDWLDFVN